MPRSAFLEGAREAGGTKTCTGALAKQKTAVPKGAASLSLAVLENDGRKTEVPIDTPRTWESGRRGKQTRAESIRPVQRLAIGKRRTGTEGNLFLDHRYVRGSGGWCGLLPCEKVENHATLE